MSIERSLGSERQSGTDTSSVELVKHGSAHTAGGWFHTLGDRWHYILYTHVGDPTSNLACTAHKCLLPPNNVNIQYGFPKATKGYLLSFLQTLLLRGCSGFDRASACTCINSYNPNARVGHLKSGQADHSSAATPEDVASPSRHPRH